MNNTDNLEIIDPEFSVEHEVEPAPYQVYGRVDGNYISRFYSTCFESYVDGDILLKEGFGDEFVHVSYLEVYDERGCHNYKVETVQNLVEGAESIKVIAMTTSDEKQAEFESFPPPPPSQLDTIQSEVGVVSTTTKNVESKTTEIISHTEFTSDDNLTNMELLMSIKTTVEENNKLLKQLVALGQPTA